MKNFKDDFFKIVNKLKNGENFSFIRFSDGELFILQNKKLILNSSGTYVDEVLCGPAYAPEDHKSFIPIQHEYFRKKLEESLTFHKKNYFVGISCKCCVGQQNCDYMKNLYGQEDEYLTWSNLFVNSNYPLFVQNFLPALKNKKVVFVCNKKADLSKLPIDVVEEFRIGTNAMIEQFNLSEEISEYIKNNDIKDHVFLFSASSLTNITAYELFKKHDNNTYIDIGTTMNIFMNLSIERSYLKSYWKNAPGSDIIKTCVW